MGGIADYDTSQVPASQGSLRFYFLYGLLLRSVLTLPGPEFAGSGTARVELFRGSTSLFSRARRQAENTQPKGEWFRHVRLSDGADYVEWSGLFEFLVSADGRRIACRTLNGASRESFQTYLVGQVLSFALLKQGIEPLHATTIVIDGEAVAFLGDCGLGKSSLGAAFLQAGYHLLTDDLLVLKEEGNRFVAYPGLPRIKLFPDIARNLLGERPNGTPMNNQTSKLVIPLDQNEAVPPEGALSLKAIYLLKPPADTHGPRITIRLLSARRAFVELTKNTFNAVVVAPERLKRQFGLASRLAVRVPVKSLSFPRAIAWLPAVRQAVLSDLNP